MAVQFKWSGASPTTAQIDTQLDNLPQHPGRLAFWRGTRLLKEAVVVVNHFVRDTINKNFATTTSSIQNMVTQINTEFSTVDSRLDALEDVTLPVLYSKAGTAVITASNFNAVGTTGFSTYNYFVGEASQFFPQNEYMVLVSATIQQAGLPVIAPAIFNADIGYTANEVGLQVTIPTKDVTAGAQYTLSYCIEVRRTVATV